MSSPGAICRRAVRDRLAHPTTGWNALIGPIAETHGAPPLSLDFSGQSRNVEHALRNPEDFDLTRMTGDLMLSIGVQRSEETRGESWAMFSGVADVVLQFLYRKLTGEDYEFDSMVEITEYVADAVEDCALQVLNAVDAVYPGITPIRSFTCERGPAEPLQDGIQKQVLIQIQFGVTL